MNRLVSYNWLKEFVSLGSVEQFAKQFSAKSQTVDRIEKIKPQFSGVITAKIIKIEPHPNADRLKLATVTDGKHEQTVVCGAPNIAEGQIVPLAKEGAVVLDSHAAGQELVIKKATIRDVESNGMLCSPRELGLGQNHEGIMILPTDTPLGKKLETVLPLQDTLLDIEITSNRPDAMSIRGLAREAGAVLGVKTNLKIVKPLIPKRTTKPLTVTVEEPQLCPRYQAVVIDHVTVKPSPLWLQARLMSAGMKPINNLVDITNYLLLEYGQPLHVFDYDSIKGQKIVIRKAMSGEKLVALDDVEYKLDSSNLVIADSKGPIAIAGVMGGKESATYAATRTIVFEVANFDPVSIRKTARQLNLHSESSNLFEKGLHPEGTHPALQQAIALALEIADGTVAGPVIDAYARPYKPKRITFNTADIQRYLGITLPLGDVKKMLVALGFTVAGSQTLALTVPWWRDHDIVIAEDVIEELARLYGYDTFPSLLPAGQLVAHAPDPHLQWEIHTKRVFEGLGFTELYHYSMVSAAILTKAGFSTKKSVAIHNPLNDDMRYLRTTLLPQLLQSVADNQHAFDAFSIFELSNVYHQQGTHDLPDEAPRLVGAVVGPDAFRHAKGALEILFRKCGLTSVTFKVPDFKNPLWQDGGWLNVYLGSTFIGELGLVHEKLRMAFGIDGDTAVFDLDFAIVTQHAQQIKVYQPIPEFPSIQRDISMIIDQQITWQQITEIIQGIDPLVTDVTYLDTYTGEGIESGKKSLSFRIVFRSLERTLQSSEVDAIMKMVIEVLQKKLDAVVR